jgi:hypothetical protein
MSVLRQCIGLLFAGQPECRLLRFAQTAVSFVNAQRTGHNPGLLCIMPPSAKTVVAVI